MLTESLQNEIWRIADSYYSKQDWAHGRSHIERVLRTATEIGKQEHADLEVIELAVILHDIFENKETHSRIEGFRHEVEASKEARKILKKLGVSEETAEAVSHCIESHRKRTSVEPRTIEAKCIFDADKLDCMGAIGIIRSAFVSYDHKQEFFKKVGDIEAYKERNIRSDGTIIDFTLHSSNLEYELSIRKAAERMYTETGKRLAEARVEFMDEFYRRFEEELNGIV